MRHRGIGVICSTKTAGRWFLLAVLLMPTCVATAEDDATALVQQAVDAIPKVPFIAQLRLTRPGEKVDLAASHKLIEGARASYLEVVGPPNLQGIRFLFLEHRNKPAEQYMKLPAARHQLLIADQARTQPFLGSSFYVADLIEPDVEAYTHRFVGETTVLGRKCRLVESVPKDPSTALYSKIISAVDPVENQVLKREMSDLKGKPFKVWEVAKTERIDGNRTILDQTMTNAQDQITSRLEVISIDYKAEPPDDVFTTQHLLK